jgi:hypothetical protein
MRPAGSSGTQVWSVYLTWIVRRSAVPSGDGRQMPPHAGTSAP